MSTSTVSLQSTSVPDEHQKNTQTPDESEFISEPTTMGSTESKLTNNEDANAGEEEPGTGDITTTDTLISEVNESEDSATESLAGGGTDLHELSNIIEEPQDRSDGSDSGLGSELCDEQASSTVVSNSVTATLGESDSETSFLDRIHQETFVKPNASTAAIPSTSFEGSQKKDDDLDAILSQAAPIKSSLKRKLLEETSEIEAQPKCKKKRGITFDSVTVYYFPRSQGFTCVPSQGGSTLGMGAQHSHAKTFSMAEHAVEQRRIHRQLLQQLRNERQVTTAPVAPVATTPTPTTNSPVIAPHHSSSDDSDSEEEEPSSDASESEMDLDNYYFLQPVPTRQRRVLLRAAGVRKIDAVEKDECRDIRSSREFCGCGCKGYCDPDTCSCSQAGIKCQVDRLSFPCGCSRDNCGNSTGRIEFNPVRVRTHFIHTLMRLELEKKQKSEEEAMKNDKHHLQHQPQHPQQHWMQSERLSATTTTSTNLEGCKSTAPAAAGKFNSSLLHDVNLNSHVEVESCVHDGSFTNLHYGAPGEGPGGMTGNFGDLPAREDSLDLYSFREDCYNHQPDDHHTAALRKQHHHQVQQPSQHHSHHHQSPYHTPTPNFHFPESIGYPATVPPPTAITPQQYPRPNPAVLMSQLPPSGVTTPTTPYNYQQQATHSFNEFPPPPPVFHSYTTGGTASSSGIPVVNYPDYKPHNYENFSSFPAAAVEKECPPPPAPPQQQYTSLNPVTTSNNKIESFSDLLNGRYSYENSTPAFPNLTMPTATEITTEKCENGNGVTNTIPAPSVDATEDCDENFGEIIKKSMVETVSA